MSSLNFQKIEIDRLAGIPRGSGFRMDSLSNDINLIHGANGSGKSLTAQSLLALVWPASTLLERPTVSGTWTLGDRTWDIEIDAGHPTWRCDGEVVDPPPLPSVESRAHHWLGLRELLTDDGPDAAATTMFAQRIARELVGGFDLEGAASKLGLTDRPAQPRKLRAALDEANGRLNDARAIESNLHNDSVRLDDLRTERDDAQKADEERRRLEKALQYRDESDEVLRLESELSAFDSALEQLRGDERARLDDLRNHISEAVGDREDAEHAAEEAERAKADTGLASDGVPNDLIQAAARDVTAIQDAHKSVQQGFADLEQARAELRALAARVASEVSEETLESMGVAPSDEMGRYARDLVSHREQSARVQARERELSEAQDRLSTEKRRLGDHSAEQLRRGHDVLSRWLSAPPQSVERSKTLLVPLLVAAGVIAVLFIALWILHHWLWLLGLVIAGVFVWVARPTAPGATKSDARATYEQEYGQNQLSQPASWTVEAVREAWGELGEAWADLKIHEAEKLRLDREMSEVSRLRRQVDASDTDLSTRREALEARLAFGIDDARADWLHVLGEHLAKWQAAKVRVDAIGARLGEQRVALSKSFSTFNSRMAPFVDNPAQRPADALGQLEDLRVRAQSYRDARTKSDQAERVRIRSQAAIDKAELQVEAMLDGLGLDKETEGRLDAWLEQRTEFLDVSQRLADARVRQSTIAADVGAGHPALSFDRSRIETERASAQREADRLSLLEQEIGAITREVENAKAGHSVEYAQQAIDRATEALARELRIAEQKVAGQAVIEWLREEASEKTQPAVLRHASGLFQRITHGRYELHVDDATNGPIFVAWDTQHEVQKALDQLSAGERVQLLVAVRLGFLEQEESGVRLPLILDETLGTTDDERAIAIIDTVVEICRSGRQVFYFTAQPDEVGKWVGRLDGVEGVELNQVSLGRIRGLAEADNSPLVIDRPAEAQLPDPAGVSHEDYGRALTVPGLDPNQPLGTVHIWHLIDDPEVLHSLLTRRIRCWGPFESLVIKGGLTVDGLDDQARQLLDARAKVVRAILAARRVGRGKPVDRAALKASDVVSDAFIERLAELCASLGGDASRLIDAIETGQVQRWRSSNTELLREYLEQEGYLDRERPLTRDEVYHLALEAAVKETRGGDLGEGWLDRVIGGLFGQ